MTKFFRNMSKIEMTGWILLIPAAAFAAAPWIVALT